MIKPNCGVAQGSIISPALFAIFIEDLAEELQTKANISMHDILMYADDILTLCTSRSQLRRAIEIIESWCEENGMELNKNKSGIVPFAPRKAHKIPLLVNKKTTEVRKRKYKSKKTSADTVQINHHQWVPDVKDVMGVPVCTEYKYLGTILTPKLCCTPQTKFIKRKAAHLQVKLGPYLGNTSAEGKRDMFVTFIMPLFNAALMLLKHEPSKTHKESLERTKKIIFKQFLGISKRTSTELVEDMLRIDINKKAELEFQNSLAKWVARVDKVEPQLETREKTKNPLKGVPGNWTELVNSQYRKCPKCQMKTTNRWHLLYAHGIRLKLVTKIWQEEVLTITEVDNRKEAKILMLTIREYNSYRLDNMIKFYLEEYKCAMTALVGENKEITSSNT